jgi:hypothetical protein
MDTENKSERSDDETGSSLDMSRTVFENQHRRAVLRVLCDEGGEADVPTLGSRLAIISDDKPLPSVIESLYSHHLPELENRDIVTFEQGGPVRLLVDTDEVTRALEQGDEN